MTSTALETTVYYLRSVMRVEEDCQNRQIGVINALLLFFENFEIQFK